MLFVQFCLLTRCDDGSEPGKASAA